MTTEPGLAESSAKRRRLERRLQRQEETRRRMAQERRRRRLIQAGVLLLLALVVVGLGVLLVNQLNRPPAGQRVIDQGRDHIARTDPHPPYNTTPPTSGWHWSDAGAPTTAGIHNEPIPDEVQVHNLEHGDVLIQYNNLSDAERQRLIDFVTRTYLRGGLAPKILVAPYPKLDTKYALTAWTWIDKFNDYDEGRISAFISAHVNNGPEKVPNAP